MGARRTINRYRTEPFGTDFNDVLKRAKTFFKDETFYITEYRGVYNAFRPSIAFKDPENAVYFEKQGRRWIRK